MAEAGHQHACNVGENEQQQTVGERSEREAAAHVKSGSFGIGGGKFSAASILAWLVVLIPLGWGVWITLQKTLVLFE